MKQAITNAAPTKPKSTSPTKFIQKIMGCALRTISRLPRALNEPSRNIKNIWRELTKRIATPPSKSKTLTIVRPNQQTECMSKPIAIPVL
jgi:hypothetical protein